TVKFISIDWPHPGQSARPAMLEPKTFSRNSSSRASRSPIFNSAKSSGFSLWSSVSNESARSTGDWERPRSQTFNKSVAVGAYCMWRSRRIREGRFTRLGHFDIPLPALVFQLEVLDVDGVGISVEIGQRLKLRDPRAIDLVADRELAGFIVKL